MKMLDLFCGAGGAAMGYSQAGFSEIVGVDIDDQPDYPFSFIKGNALRFPISGFDFVHASPPCQAFTAMRVMPNARKHSDLLAPIRRRILKSGLPYVIENVVGAPLINPILLCGSMFDLGTKEPNRQLRRHRLFETNFFVLAPPCTHRDGTIGIYGDHARDRRRKERTGQAGVDFPDAIKIPLAQEALGIGWMKSWRSLSQSIPPAYTRFLGEHIVKTMKAAA